MLKLSPYQKNIIEWVKNGTGHACCNAVAGSGKSTTLLMAAKALVESGIKIEDIKICVFGAKNAEDLKQKFGYEWSYSISTLHSTGWSLIKNKLEITEKNGRNLVVGYKYNNIAQNLGYTYNKRRGLEAIRSSGFSKDSNFLKVVDLVRLTNTKINKNNLPYDIEDICSHFEIKSYGEDKEINYYKACEAVYDVLKVGENQAKNKLCFDFTDQIWLPTLWNIKPNSPYKFLLVDEAQDLNAAQLEMIVQLVGDTGRILAVGDKFQAIMGFSGADNRSPLNPIMA